MDAFKNVMICTYQTKENYKSDRDCKRTGCGHYQLEKFEEYGVEWPIITKTKKITYD